MYACLSQDLDKVLDWGTNLAQLNASKSQTCTSQIAHIVIMNDLILENKVSFHLVEVTFERNLN